MIIIDVETTGFDSKNNSIVSIGAVDFNNPTKQFYIENRIWGGAEIFEGGEQLLPGPGYISSLVINGFTKEQITDKNKPTLKEAMELFIKWCESCNSRLFGGHNPYFDLDFLRSSALREKITWNFGHGAVDLHTAVYLNYKQRGLTPPKLRSTDCFNYVGLPEEPKPHNALTGAKLEAEAFSRLVYGKNLLEEFKQYKIPEYLKK